MAANAAMGKDVGCISAASVVLGVNTVAQSDALLASAQANVTQAMAAVPIANALVISTAATLFTAQQVSHSMSTS